MMKAAQLLLLVVATALAGQTTAETPVAHPFTDDDFKPACKEWVANAAVAEKKYGHISGWDTSRVTDMSYAFQSASAFNEDIGGWNTSSATNMEYMFYYSVFNQNIGGWDTTSVTNMKGMFSLDAAFNQDIGGWDTSSVTHMAEMFLRATVFNRNIGGWDTSRVLTMNNMFAFAPAFNQDLSCWSVESAEFDGNENNNYYAWTVDTMGLNTPAELHPGAGCDPTPSPTPAPTPSPTTADPTCVPDFDEEEAINFVFRMYNRNAGGDATGHKDSEGKRQTTTKLLADYNLDNKKGRRTLKMLATRTVRALRKSQGWDQK